MSSVELIEEFPPQQPSLDSWSLLKSFLEPLPLPPNAFVIGPEEFDPQTLIFYISTAHPKDHGVPLRSGTYPYQVPVNFFYPHFPPNTASIMEIE